MTIPTLPSPSPSRSQSQSVFDSAVDAFVGALPATITAMNTDIATANADNAASAASAVSASASASSSAASAVSASTSAASAASYATAVAWVSGTTYAVGVCVTSPTNGRIYKRIVAGAGTTDPSLDTTNWTPAMLDGSANALSFNAITATLPAITIVAHCSHFAKNDTDKGAWRKRKGQSWRSETRTAGKYAGGLGYATAALAVAAGYGLTDYYYNTTNSRFEEITATGTPASTVTYRAGREDYPTNAYITAEAARVIIFDMDGAQPSMWGVLSFGSGTISAVSALNGSIVLGYGTAGIWGYDLVTGTPAYRHNATAKYFYQSMGFATFSAFAFSNIGSDTTKAIVNNTVNSVAITVLPDAPYENGMPVPTIYAFTAGGVSRIAHDGTVSSTASGINTYGYIDGSNVFAGRGGIDYTAIYSVASALPSGGASPLGTYWGYYIANSWASTRIPSGIVPYSSSKDALAGTAGLVLHKMNDGNRGASMQSTITTTYNTGYMVGDIRRCWLADSLSGTIADTALITGDSSTFAGGTVGSWASTTVYTSTAAVVAGELQITVAGTYGKQYLAITTVVGKSYKVSADLRLISGGGGALLQIQTTTPDGGGGNILASGTINGTAVAITQIATFVATTTTTYVEVGQGGAAAGVVGADNITMVEVSADRSVKNKPLSVVGTLTRTAYTGGRSVYSGFSAANYFQEASHADWNALGTGDFSIIMSGVKWGTAGVARYIVASGNSATEGSFYLALNTGNALQFFITNAATADVTICTSTATFTDTAEHVVEVKRYTQSGVASTVAILVDGVVVASAVSTLTISNATGYFRIGANRGLTAGWDGGQVSTVRISAATAPTAEQSKYIAQQENALNGGSACLLSNSSSVTSLTHHTDTGLLEVENGTATDFFSGLARVGSVTTTSGITGAVSEGQLPNVALLNSGTTNKFWSAERNVKAELLEAQVVFPREQQYSFTTPAATTTQALPQGWKARGIAFNTTDSTFLGTYGQTFDGFVFTLTGLTASKAYQINLVEAL